MDERDQWKVVFNREGRGGMWRQHAREFLEQRGISFQQLRDRGVVDRIPEDCSDGVSFNAPSGQASTPHPIRPIVPSTDCFPGLEDDRVGHWLHSQLESWKHGQATYAESNLDESSSPAMTDCQRLIGQLGIDLRSSEPLADVGAIEVRSVWHASPLL